MSRRTAADAYRRQVVKEISDDNRLTAGRHLWNRVAAYSLWDEIAIALATLTGIVWAARRAAQWTVDNARDAEARLWAEPVYQSIDGALTWILRLDLAALVVFAIMLATPQWRRYLADRHADGVERLWVSTHIMGVLDVHPSTKHSSIVPGTVEVGPIADEVDPDPISILPTPRPSWIRFAAKPNTSCDMQRLVDDYARLLGYVVAVPDDGSSPTGVVVCHLQRDPAVTVESFPVDPERLAVVWPELMARLDLIDPHGDHPQLVSWETATAAVSTNALVSYAADLHDTNELPAVARSVFRNGPPSTARAVIFPTPSQTTVKARTALVDALADVFGMADHEATYTPSGGLVVTFWQTSRPTTLPIHPDLLVDNWDAVAAELWPESPVRPALIRTRVGPIVPELSDGVDRRASFLHPRPESISFQLDIGHPSNRRAVEPTIAERLAYYRTRTRYRDDIGLVIDAFRDPLPKGVVIDLPNLVDTDGRFHLGAVHGDDMTWDPRIPDLAHIAVAGRSGAGKGDLQLLLMAGGLMSDWDVFYLNPKGDAAAETLLDAVAEVRSLRQAAALMTLASIEQKLRQWKITEASRRLGMSIRSLNEYQSLAAAGDAIPLGPRFLINFDETAVWTNPDDDKNFDKDTKDLRVGLRHATAAVATLARSSGGHLVVTTQNPKVNNFGGSTIVNNCGFKVMLANESPQLLAQFLPASEPEDIDRLAGGGGKGHNFHTGPNGSVIEGQCHWITDHPDWIGDAIVPGYLAARPGHQARTRDFRSELVQAITVFGAHVLESDEPDFGHVDHAQYPSALSGAPFGTPRTSQTATQPSSGVLNADNTDDWETALQDLLDGPDAPGAAR